MLCINRPALSDNKADCDKIPAVMKLTETVPSRTDSFYETNGRSWKLFLFISIMTGQAMTFLWSRDLQTALLISLGAVLGANLRYWFCVWAGQRWGTQYPFATMIINLAGSLILGFFVTVITERFMIDPRWRVFFAIGFLGSYTTFSTYTYESITLLMQGNWSLGIFNLLGSAILGGLAAVLGIVLGRWV